MNLYTAYEQEHIIHKFSSKLNLITYVPDTTSITHTNLYAKAIKGIVYNFKTIVMRAKQNNVSPYRIQDHVTRFFIQLYHDYLRCAKDAPELLEYNMNKPLYNFNYEYPNDVFNEKINKNSFEHHYKSLMPLLLKQTSTIYPRININRFLGEIKND